MLLPTKGFTLIEVLIALVVISIALTAIIKTTSITINHTQYLVLKTEANYVAEDILNQCLMRLLPVPKPPENVSHTTRLLGESWVYTAKRSPTPNPHIDEIQVKVFKKGDEQILADVMSYLYDS